MVVRADRTGTRARNTRDLRPLAAAWSDHDSRPMNGGGRSIEHLPRAECLRLMGSVPVGRIFYTQWAMPAVAVVNFALDRDESIVIRTDASGKLWPAIRQAVVAFETDRLDEATRSGWSVTVVGRAEEVIDAGEAAGLRTLGLDPWAPGERDHFIRIRPEIVTGRRVRASHQEP